MAIILASQSPRRRQLLEQMGFTDFLIRPAQGEELADPNLDPGGLVEALSRQKALEISASADPEDLIIAADTVVAVDGQVLGKPHSIQQAHEMLSALSGREQKEIKALRESFGIRPAFKMVDTCAAEFEAQTPYYYSTYDQENEAAGASRADDGAEKRKVLVPVSYTH
mgnify:CR=1 FL=1